MAHESKLHGVKARVAQIPLGTYRGIWSGYVVTFTDSSGRVYDASTSTGIRGSSQCRVHVTESDIRAEVIDE